MLRVDVVSNAPTPYNAALFSELSALVDLRVHFEVAARAIRPWIGDFQGGYEATVHDGSQIGRWGTWAPRLVRGLRGDADVLILGGSYTSPTVANLLLRKRSGTMRIFWGERFRTESATLSALRGLLLSRTDVVLAVGDRAAAQYRRVTTRPVSVLPYACEAGAFGAKGHRERVGFVGQLIERKGVDTLLEACEMTGHREIDVVGSGPLEAGLRRDAQSRRLDVRWYGERRNAEVGAIRDAWAYQVVPSRYDGWGVVVNESLASGVPVVVSDGVGASELVRSGIDGWIHTAGSATSLASAMDSAHEARGQERLRTAARAVGVAFSAGPAASFVASVLNEPDVVRSFVQEQWGSLGDRFAGWPDRDDGVPQFAPGTEPPPS